MSQPARDSARCAIEARFQESVDRDLTGLAVQGCREQELIAPDGTPAGALCRGSHAGVTRLIWRDFTPDWREVVYVYDGTRAEQTRYLNAKLHLTIRLAAAGDEPTPEVRAALLNVRAALFDLWRVWAGYQATTTDALAAAVTEFEDVR